MKNFWAHFTFKRHLWRAKFNHYLTHFPPNTRTELAQTSLAKCVWSASLPWTFLLIVMGLVFLFPGWFTGFWGIPSSLFQTALQNRFFLGVLVLGGLMPLFNFVLMWLLIQTAKRPDFQTPQDQLEVFKNWLKTQVPSIQALAPSDQFITPNDIQRLQKLSEISSTLDKNNASSIKLALQKALEETPQTHVTTPRHKM